MVFHPDEDQPRNETRPGSDEGPRSALLFPLVVFIPRPLSLTPRISCALTSQKWDLQARGRYCFVLLFIALAVADPVASSLPMNATGPEVLPVVSVDVLAGGRYAPRLSLRDNLDPPA